MTTQTTCPYCGTGCGVLVNYNSNGSTTVTGDTSHPANRGRLCSKGSALAETLSDESDQHRLQYPVIDGQRASWYQAVDYIARRLDETIESYGPESIAFYVSGQLLTEDYYVINKLTKGWLGTANIDSNTRLGMASSVTGHKRAFGSDTVPGCYEDLETADLIILVGSNLAWCHPVLFQRIMAEKQRRPGLYLIVIDPRRTSTAEQADLHLPIQPDSDTRLFNALLSYLARHDAIDWPFVEKHVNGFEAALEASGTFDVKAIADSINVDARLLQTFFQQVRATPKTVTLFSQGVNQSSSGSDKVNAIINCHLATGRIGQAGMGPFSITGQPNAMGGREVGGLATMLAAHMELNNPDHRRTVQDFWHSPRIASHAGLCAVDLFEAIREGKIKAVWILGSNPVDSLPEANNVKTALQACPLVIVSEVSSSSDTLACATVQLPALAWGEKEGTVTNSERCISRQRAVRKPHFDARPDWWAISQVACRLGFYEQFTYSGAADIFREHARLSTFRNKGSRDFDIGACAQLTDKDYDNLKPFYWPWSNGQAPREPIRFFAQGAFHTNDGKGRMLAIHSATPSHQELSDHFPLLLNTGRIRDQWHTMTRTGYSPHLSSHLSEPYLEIHPHDALLHGIKDADIIRVRSPHGSILMRALLSERQRLGEVFAPMHWTDVFSSQARVGTLISGKTDPHSQQPALKSQIVSVQRFSANSYAYALLRFQPRTALLHDIDYWACVPVLGGWQVEIASTIGPKELEVCLRQRLSLPLQSHDINVLSHCDRAMGVYRVAVFETQQLELLLFTAGNTVEVSRSWATEQLSADWSEPAKRWQLLAGRFGNDRADKGAIVCSCFNVGTHEIEQAGTTKQCTMCRP